MLLSPRLDLFVPTARFPCFRQPVLLNAGDHLLAFAENRNVSSCAPSISSNEIGSLQLRRSADNGATWTAMQQVWRGNIDFYTAVHDTYVARPEALVTGVALVPFVATLPFSKSLAVKNGAVAALLVGAPVAAMKVLDSDRD